MSTEGTFKRRRIQAAKRPIDKQLINVRFTTVAGTQVAEEIVAIASPCTITGLRWAFASIQDGGTGQCRFQWAIVVSFGGSAPSTMSLTSGSTVYSPEKDVMAFGVGLIDNNTVTIVHEGSTKTMRKLMIGDTLDFIMLGIATDTVQITGIIQVFCKF